MKSMFQIILSRVNAPFLAVPPAIALSPRAITDPRDSSSCAAVAPTRPLVRASNYAWAAGAAIVALGLHFYYLQELLAQFALFSFVFFSFSIVGLSLLFVWYAGNQAVTWASPAWRTAATFFRRLASQVGS
jgi:hypothetical protein